ncbi:hypothetical protein SAMN05443665_1022119, partial [Actinomadura meyerae]
MGITLANAVPLTGTASPAGGQGHWAYETLLHQRFFPIFSFLFGLSFGLFLDAVQQRTRSPRLLMLARLGFLIPFGALHRVLQPREVLLTYAIVGIAVLLPASFLPGWRTILVLGGAATTAAALTTGGSTLIPGLFLLGFAAKYGEQELLTLPTSSIGAALASIHRWCIEVDLSVFSGGRLSCRPPAGRGDRLVCPAFPRVRFRSGPLGRWITAGQRLSGGAWRVVNNCRQASAQGQLR